MVITSKFRTGQYTADDHREGTPLLILQSLELILPLLPVLISKEDHHVRLVILQFVLCTLDAYAQSLFEVVPFLAAVLPFPHPLFNRDP